MVHKGITGEGHFKMRSSAGRSGSKRRQRTKEGKKEKGFDRGNYNCCPHTPRIMAGLEGWYVAGWLSACDWPTC